MSNLIRFASLF